jgi:hypothetical protein
MNQWSATRSTAYLAGARLLARLERNRDVAMGLATKKSKRTGGGGGKRKSNAAPDDAIDVAIEPTKRARKGNEKNREAEGGYLERQCRRGREYDRHLRHLPGGS